MLPAWFIVALWRDRAVDRCSWFLKVLYSGAFIAYMLMMARWDLATVFLRHALVILFAVAVLRSSARAKRLPWLAASAARRNLRAHALPLLLLLIFSSFLGSAARGYFYSKAAVALQFPLHEGWFYVVQGGNSKSINHHNSSREQRYALDIVALNSFGSRARGIYPEALARYVIFGEPVHSPCDGRVLSAVDRYPDQTPPQMDKQHAAGNHVVIACKGVRTLLAHLQRGSVSVTPGQPIRTGTLLGLVGNSGNTSEPHLHFHAVRAESDEVLQGAGVPVTFNGRFPVRNSTF